MDAKLVHFKIKGHEMWN